MIMSQIKKPKGNQNIKLRRTIHAVRMLFLGLCNPNEYNYIHFKI